MQTDTIGCVRGLCPVSWDNYARQSCQWWSTNDLRKKHRAYHWQRGALRQDKAFETPCNFGLRYRICTQYSRLAVRCGRKANGIPDPKMAMERTQSCKDFHRGMSMCMFGVRAGYFILYTFFFCSHFSKFLLWRQIRNPSCHKEDGG